jgi:hypothetical protein
MMTIGDRNAFSNNVSLCAMGEISIGDDGLLGDQVAIYDCDFHELTRNIVIEAQGQFCPWSLGTMSGWEAGSWF